MHFSNFGLLYLEKRMELCKFVQMLTAFVILVKLVKYIYKKSECLGKTYPVHLVLATGWKVITTIDQRTLKLLSRYLPTYCFHA